MCAYGAYHAFFRADPLLYVWGALLLGLPWALYAMLATEITYVMSPAERWRQEEAFKRRVEAVEEKYRERPEALRNLTVFWALLGYLSVCAVVAAMAVLGAAAAGLAYAFFGVAAYAAVAFLPFAWFAFKLLWPLLRPAGGDRGVALTPSEAPRLFGLLRKIEKLGRGRRFEKVFIDMEMNASVSRSGGIKGIFGFGPVTLNLGLPLMQALSVNQLAGVLAHEYGHVAGNHNALAHWVYRIRHNWIRIGDTMRREELWHLLQCERLYQWFMRYFKAYSFVLARQCEYEADAVAAGIAGARNITEALAAIESKAQCLHADFWPKLWKLADTYPDPCGTPYRIMGEYLKTCDAEDGAQPAPVNEPDADATHPPLHLRVQALGVPLRACSPLQASAATKLLGEVFELQLGAVFDAVWARKNKRAWRARYRRYQSARYIVQRTDLRRLGQLTDHELIRCVNAAHAVEDYNAVIAGCEVLLQRDPDNVSAKVNRLGYGLVHENKEIHLLQLDELVALHPEYLPQASTFALQYLNGQGRHKEAAVYQYRLDDWNYKYQAAEEERRHIFAGDVFSPHGIAPEYIRRIVEILAEHDAVKKAWVVRKEVLYFKDSKPLFVVVLQHGWLSPQEKDKILRRIEKAFYRAAMPPFFRFFWIDEHKSLKTKIKKLKEALVYTR